MVFTFVTTEDLINSMIQINSTGISEIKVFGSKSKKLHISCKYFLTLFDIHNDLEINNFFSYINDETRTIEYPYVKNNQIDYSMMLEKDQFYNIELENTNLNIKDISTNIDNFIKIVKESCGQIVLVLDICYLLNFMLGLKMKNIPNHLVDMILYKLSNSEISEISEISSIYILDKQSVIKNTSNLFYTQLDLCMSLSWSWSSNTNTNTNTNNNNNSNSDSMGLNLNKNIKLNEKIISENIIIYKNVEESLVNNVYWNVLKPEMKISKHVGIIKSPFDNSQFNLVIINDKEYFVKKINISECVDKNIFNLDKNPGIIIDPIERLFI